jgi:hypothetical protein
MISLLQRSSEIIVCWKCRRFVPVKDIPKYVEDVWELVCQCVCADVRI